MPLPRLNQMNSRTAAPDVYRTVRSLFGSSLIGYWPLDDPAGTFVRDQSGNGLNAVTGGTTRPTLGAAGIGDGRTAASFPATSAYVNLYSAALASKFSGAEGTLIVWAKVSAAGVWSDAAYRVIADLYMNSNNYVTFARSNTYNNMILIEHKAGGTSRNHYAAFNAPTTWVMIGVTWSVSGAKVVPYVNGAKALDVAAPGTWSGTLSSAGCVLGALTTAAGSLWSGSIAHAILLNRAATEAEMLSLYRNWIGAEVICVIGDSISAPAYNSLMWTDMIRDSYNGGRVAITNHAVSGQSIMAHMDAQVMAAANDAADIIIIEMGTNDGSGVGVQAEVEENIIELRASNPNATIYYVNVLPRWTDATGATPVDKSYMRTPIAAACAAQGVNCWDTYTTPWITAADTADGLHPNASGKVKLYNQIAQRLTKTFYVSTAGNDSNVGSLASPWRTIQHAADYALAGDTVYIRGGTYTERVDFDTNSGRAGQYITFTAYPGETPVIDGTGLSFSDSGLINLVNVDYVKINGLTVQDSDDYGISADSCAYIDITNCTTNNTHSSGIYFDTCDHVTAINNTVVNARCVTLANGGHEESISVVATTNFEVSYNDISMNGVEGYLGNEGIDCKAGARFGSVHHNYIHGYTVEGGAIYVDAWDALTGDIDIYCNRCWGNPNGIVINSERGGTVQNVNIYNNQVYNVYDTGIGIGDTGTDGLRRNIAIYHNTIYKAQYNGGAAIYIRSANISGVTVINNITYFQGTNGQIVATTAAIAAKVTANNNLSYGSTAEIVAGCVEMSENPGGYVNIYDNLTGNPVFVSTVTPDLHLQASSPAIGAASDLGLTTDFDGANRSLPDIGAFEYGG